MGSTTNETVQTYKSQPVAFRNIARIGLFLLDSWSYAADRKGSSNI